MLVLEIEASKPPSGVEVARQHIKRVLRSEDEIQAYDKEQESEPDDLCCKNIILTYPTGYSWIAFSVDAHEKLIWQATRKVTTIPRPPLESSRRGEFRSEWSFFV